MNQKELVPIEAERAVLGAVLADTSILAPVSEIISAHDFGVAAHEAIFSAFLELDGAQRPVDHMTVAERLKEKKLLETVGGNAYLMALDQGVPLTYNAPEYAKAVKAHSVRRAFAAAGREVTDAALSGAVEADALPEYADKRLSALQPSRARGDFRPASDYVVPLLDQLDRMKQAGSGVTGLATGFHDVDNLLTGLHPGELIILAARPGIGKTSLAMNVALNVALRGDKSAGVFSLEMPADQLLLRMMASNARVDLKKLRGGRLSPHDEEKFMEACGRVGDAPVYIDDSGDMSPLEARAKARRLKQKDPRLGLLVVDYLQLMRMKGKTESRHVEVGEISRSLKQLAKELEIPILALSQLNRKVEERKGGKPMLSDLRECVTGDTLVALSNGRRVPIQELVGQTPEVISLSENGRIVHARADMVWSVGRRPVQAMTLASGRRITATQKHRLLTLVGWREVGSLKAGDRIAIARTLPSPAIPISWPEARLALLGQLIGDGSYLKGQPIRYTTGCELNSAIVKNAAESEFGCTVTRHTGRNGWHQLVISGNGTRWKPAGLNLWLRELGLFNQRAHQKHLPPEVFSLANEQVAFLLRHLWATDGTISTRTGGKGSHTIAYSTTSPRLAADIAALLLRFGLVARTNTTKKPGYRSCYTVSIQGCSQQRIFLEHVGAFGRRVSPAQRLAEALKSVEANTNVDTIPIEVFDRVKDRMRERGISQRAMAGLRGTAYGGSAHFNFSPSRDTLLHYAKILQDEELKEIATSDLFWDEILSIDPAGEAEVYDLTVPGPASWLADGIVSHNSGAIEQDADVVMFIHREQVTKEENAEDASAREIFEVELIVAKQRNGPIGEVPLIFHGPHTRFDSKARGGWAP